MLAATLDRFPVLRDLRVQFAALACVTALPFVAGASYDIWYAMQTSSGTILSEARSDVIEVRIGGLALALLTSGLLAVLMLHRMMPARDAARASETPSNPRALNVLLERRVETRTRELERSIEELESYAGVISRELHGPLQAIDACTTLLETHQRAKLDQEGVALLGRLRNNSQRMAALVDAVIEYSRLGRRWLVLQSVEMSGIVRSTIDDMRLGRQERTRISIGGLPSVPADATLLSLVWRQLIDNALKFSAQASEREVRIEGAVRHGVAEFRVTDRGVGFDPAQEEKLFKLFGRLHGEDGYAGAGTGLAFVKRVVERHGGCVWAEGQPGKGATFGFALPLGAAPEMAARG
jgi:light-regulated signal transduction histidine kinase (bacteriophytochrome)